MKKLFTSYIRPRETLVATFYSHPAAFSLSLLLSIGFLLSAVFFFIPLIRYGNPGLVVIGIFLFLSGILLLRVLTLRKNNAMLITDERVIYLKRAGVLEEEVVEVPLDLVSDIRFKKKGPWQMGFNFGTIFIKSQSGEPVEIINIPQPRKIQELLFELQAQRMKHKNYKQAVLVNEFLNIAKTIKKPNAKRNSEED
jgi:hypothetical protein